MLIINNYSQVSKTENSLPKASPKIEVPTFKGYGPAIDALEKVTEAKAKALMNKINEIGKFKIFCNCNKRELSYVQEHYDAIKSFGQLLGQNNNLDAINMELYCLNFEKTKIPRKQLIDNCVDIIKSDRHVKFFGLKRFIKKHYDAAMKYLINSDLLKEWSDLYNGVKAIEHNEEGYETLQKIRCLGKKGYTEEYNNRDFKLFFGNEYKILNKLINEDANIEDVQSLINYTEFSKEYNKEINRFTPKDVYFLHPTYTKNKPVINNMLEVKDTNGDYLFNSFALKYLSKYYKNSPDDTIEFAQLKRRNFSNIGYEQKYFLPKDISDWSGKSEISLDTKEYYESTLDKTKEKFRIEIIDKNFKNFQKYKKEYIRLVNDCGAGVEDLKNEEVLKFVQNNPEIIEKIIKVSQEKGKSYAGIVELYLKYPKDKVDQILEINRKNFSAKEMIEIFPTFLEKPERTKELLERSITYKYQRPDIKDGRCVPADPEVNNLLNINEIKKIINEYEQNPKILDDIDYKKQIEYVNTYLEDDIEMHERYFKEDADNLFGYSGYFATHGYGTPVKFKPQKVITNFKPSELYKYYGQNLHKDIFAGFHKKFKYWRYDLNEFRKNLKIRFSLLKDWFGL